MPVRSEWRTYPSRMRHVVAVVSLVAVACLAAAVSFLPSTTVPVGDVWKIAAVVVAVAVSDDLCLKIRFGHQTERYTLSEVVLVVAFAALPAAVCVPAAALGAVAIHVAHRRSAVKVAFNVAMTTVGYASAAVVVSAVAGGSAGPPGPGAATLLGLAAAAIVYNVESAVLTAAVVSLAAGTSLRSRLRESPLLRVLTLVGNAVLGVGCVALARWNPAVLWFAPPAAGIAYALYSAQLRSTAQRDAWRRLNAAGAELTHLDVDGLRERAADRARELFRPDTVQILLDVPARAVPDHPGPRGVRAWLTRPPKVREVVGALPGTPGRTGVLRLGFDAPVVWTAHERQVFTAFAQLVGAALGNARLYAAAAYDAVHDPLTGLGNRRMLAERAPAVLAAAAGSPTRAGLLVIDLDRFKEVNDTLGHSTGDLLLRAVGERVRQAVRSIDLVVRLGGDEFAVLVTGLHSPEAVEAVGVDLARHLAEPGTVGDVTLAVEASVGVACYPDDGDTLEVLLQHADIAMYEAKRSADRCQRYRPASVPGVGGMTLAADLRRALDDGGHDLHLRYAPVVCAATGELARLDARLGWDHRSGQRLAAASFLPAVEQSVLVRPLASLVLGRALAAWAGWRAAGHDVGLSVNLSTRNLLDPTLPSELARLLLAHDLPAEKLVVAVTGPSLLADPVTRGTPLRATTDLGVRLAVGGVAADHALTLLPAETLGELRVRPGAQSSSTTRATVQLAHTLAVRVVAAGVDDDRDAAAMARAGCDLLEGRHAGPALDADEVLDRLGGGGPVPTLAQVVPIRSRGRT